MLATTTAEQTNNSRAHLGAWFDLSNDGVVLLKTGKVELGQGILLALRQIAAEELGLPLEAIETISGDTALSPFEGGTFGSMSVESSAPLVRQAAAELRDHMFEVAAMRLQAPRPAIGARDGQFLLDGATTSETYWTARVDLRMDIAITGMAAPKPIAQYGIVGTSPRSTATIERLSAGAYIHDTRLNGMLHGRVLHKPHSEARLEHADVGRVEIYPESFA
jgi:nicotinate dehydrogenase subunit B